MPRNISWLSIHSANPLWRTRVVAEVLAKNDTEQIKKMGQIYGGEIVSDVYKNLVVDHRC